ncbi:MAG TPA: NUDIX domain-containing protein [Patescibacteria group bacterium]|nr:NUDIX domain-containing protein [Patescibacteria group bacterium]
MEQKIIDKLAWIYIKERKILSTLSKGKDKFYIPGGKRNNGETNQEALAREILEELSINLIPDTVNYFGKFEAQAHGKAEGIIVRMTCYTGEYSGELKADNEIEKIVWLQYNDKVNCSPVDNIIFDYLKEKNLID